jgi:hypothetical protein
MRMLDTIREYALERLPRAADAAVSSREPVTGDRPDAAGSGAIVICNS